jgi:hypothetical protein
LNWCRRISLALVVTLIATPAPAGPMPTNQFPAAGSQQPAATNPSPTTLPGAGAAPATVIEKNEGQEILGKDVRSAADEEMGHIVNVIVDGAGQPRAAIIDFGGFLGVGSRKIAVDWGVLHFDPSDASKALKLDLTRDEVKATPEYKEGEPVVVLGSVTKAPQAPNNAPPATSR